MKKYFGLLGLLSAVCLGSTYSVYAISETNFTLEVLPGVLQTQINNSGKSRGNMHSLNVMKGIASIRLYDYTSSLTKREEFVLDNSLGNFLFRMQVRHTDPTQRTDLYFRAIKIIQGFETKYSYHPKKLAMLKYVNNQLLSQIELVEAAANLEGIDEKINLAGYEFNKLHYKQDEIGVRLFDTNYKSIYITRFDRKGVSRCSGSCIETRPIYDAGASLKNGFETIVRLDGTKQTTRFGQPLYYFAEDDNSYEAGGHGLLDLRYVADKTLF